MKEQRKLGPSGASSTSEVLESKGKNESTGDFLLTLLSVLITVRRMGPWLKEQRLAAG